MPQPIKSQMHIDKAMTNVSIAFKNDMFIAEQVFPIVNVQKDSDKYFTFDKGSWFRDESRPRGPGSQSARSGYGLGTGDYSTVEYSMEKLIPDEDRRNADAPLSPDRNATQFVTNSNSMRLERQVASIVTAWSAAEDAGGFWGAASGDTFFTDIRAGTTTIRQAIGTLPNSLLIDHKTWQKLQDSDDLLQRIKYMGTSTNPAKVTKSAVASLFELDRVVVGTAIYSDAEETQAGDDFNAVDIWEKNAGKGMGFLYYVPPSAALENPSSGYIIVSQPRMIERYREEDKKSDVIRGSMKWTTEVTSVNSGYLFYDTFAT
jgi:hypothetical protein